MSRKLYAFSDDYEERFLANSANFQCYTQKLKPSFAVGKQILMDIARMDYFFNHVKYVRDAFSQAVLAMQQKQHDGFLDLGKKGG